eukprot:m.132758 g.132758  ORF g.132758 m.132758 type:complete len:454 (+) comp29630_c0_seq1:358-1719(+)
MAALSRETTIGCTVALIVTMGLLRLYTCEPTTPRLAQVLEESTTVAPMSAQLEQGLSEHELAALFRFKEELLIARTKPKNGDEKRTIRPDAVNPNAKNVNREGKNKNNTNTNPPPPQTRPPPPSSPPALPVVTTTAKVPPSPPPPPPPANLTILLIRAHTQTEGMMDRAIAFAQSFDAAFKKTGKPGHVWVDFDTTLVQGVNEQFKHYVLSNPKTRGLLGRILFTHTFNTAGVLKKYPLLQQARDRGAGGWSNHASIGFGFHTESMTVWYDDLPQSHKDRLQYLWVFEADVAYRGPNIVELFDSYDRGEKMEVHTVHDKGPSTQIDRDIAFIADGCHDPGGWMHSNANSDAYRAYAHDLTQREVAVEAVQRFTKKMINNLLIMNKRGMHTWSEQAGCTFANVAGWPTTRLKREHIGNPFTYFEAVQLRTMDAWNAFFKKKDDPTKKLYHPVKF